MRARDWRCENKEETLVENDLFAALIASVILSAGSAPAQEQPGGAGPAVEASAAPAAPASAAPATTPAPATAAPVQQQPGTQPNVTLPAEAGSSTVMELTLPRDLSPWGMFMAADIIVRR